MMNGISKQLLHSQNLEGRGVATKLIKHVLETYPDEKWSLNCDLLNDGALHVYKKLGFQPTSEFDLYGHMHYHMVHIKD